MDVNRAVFNAVLNGAGRGLFEGEHEKNPAFLSNLRQEAVVTVMEKRAIRLQDFENTTLMVTGTSFEGSVEGLSISRV